MKSKLKVAVVQHDCLDSYSANLEKSLTGIIEASKKNCDLVLLPELHTLPYFCISEDKNNFKLAESIPGPTTDRLCKQAKQSEIVIVNSLFEKTESDIYYNTAVVIDKNGTIAGCYRKMHIPYDPGYYEKFYFSPGNQGFQPLETSVGKLGVLVCWDQWFPEAARLMTLSGAEILLYPSAIGWDTRDSQDEQDRQLDSWITIQRSHAIANQIPILSSNRVGTESSPTDNAIQNVFWGSSFIAGPQGEILSQAGVDQSSVIVADIPLNRTKELRETWPFFRDRRIDAYGKLSEDNKNK
ncbi:MAG: N-carbamoylputrescine amidase [Gammaproteobacteria bacterium]|jgi:N-carbamoylputrescine amidase